MAQQTTDEQRFPHGALIPAIPAMMIMEEKVFRHIPTVVMDGEAIHTSEQPFCFFDLTCPCHEDQLLIAEVDAFVQERLLTPQEATHVIAGKAI